MPVKVLRIRLAGRDMGVLEKTFMGEDEQRVYADAILSERSADCDALDAALYDGWQIVGQGQMETEAGLFHYFILQGVDFSDLDDTDEAEAVAPGFTDLGRLALQNGAYKAPQESSHPCDAYFQDVPY